MTRTIPVIVVLGLFSLLVGTLAGQSVADVAKKSQQQAGDKKAQAVSTNDTPPAPAKSPAGTPAGTTPGTPQAPGDPASPGNRSQLENEYLQKYRDLYTQYEENRLLFEKYDAERYHSNARYYHDRMDKNMEQIKALEEQARKDGLEPGLSRQAHKDVRKKMIKEGKLKE